MSDLHPVSENFGENVLDGAPAVHMSARDRWLARRLELVTASDVAAILGEHPSETPADVFVVKVGLRKKSETIPMRYGNAFQDGIGEVYSFVTGRRVKMVPRDMPELDMHPDVPWLGASRDGDVWGSAEHPNPLGLAVEPQMGGTFEAKASALFDLWPAGADCPTHFVIQSQIQQACAGRHWGVVAAFLSMREAPKSQDILFDKELVDLMIPRLEEFRHYVQKKEPPVHLTSWWSAAAVKAYYKTDNGEVKEIDDDTMATVEKWEAMRADRLVEEKKEEELQKQLRLAMGAAAIGELPDGRFLTLNTTPGGWVERFERSASRTLRLTKNDPRKKRGKKITV